MTLTNLPAPNPNNVLPNNVPPFKVLIDDQAADRQEGQFQAQSPFYPHFAMGMWYMWRNHDVFEAGTRLQASGRLLKEGKSEEQRLTAVIHHWLGHPFQLCFVYLDAFPATPGGKFEDFISRVSA